jgi:hypothetical protein
VLPRLKEDCCLAQQTILTRVLAYLFRSQSDLIRKTGRVTNRHTYEMIDQLYEEFRDIIFTARIPLAKGES